jgi:hypothetical protein
MGYLVMLIVYLVIAAFVFSHVMTQAYKGQDDD